MRFSERQATAILEMRIYKLIGLEIEALQKEYDETVKNIAIYEDILENHSSMTKSSKRNLMPSKKLTPVRDAQSLKMRRRLCMKKRKLKKCLLSL